MTKGERFRVVVIGAGFAGLSCARSLTSTAFDVVLIDRQNHHCFQPLLYQVATGALSPNDIAWPVRSLVRRHRNITTLMAEVRAIDATKRLVICDGVSVPYDYLVVATGVTHSYFGHDDWAESAPGLKHIDDAIRIRRRMLAAFEIAERDAAAGRPSASPTFVIVGGGPTGVELAGAAAELARTTLKGEFRRIDPQHARIILVEGGPRILPTYPERLSVYSARALARKGVDVRLGVTVTSVDEQGVDTSAGRIDTAATVWAAGVKASAVASWLGLTADRAGRVVVQPDLSVAGHDNIFVVGDAASVSSTDGKQAPGIAPAAKQMGKHAAKVIRARVSGKPGGSFRYRHQGDLATIGRNEAVVKIGGLSLVGFPGWVFWSAVHIFFLISARNRIAVAFNWLWDYLTGQRSVRLISARSDSTVRHDP